MPLLHVMTQDNQPYMSERKCCECCGYAWWVWDDDDGYVSEKRSYTKEVAESNDLTRCCDKVKEKPK